MNFLKLFYGLIIIIFYILVLTASFLLLISYYCNQILDLISVNNLLNEYDYIIVGAGSSGSVVAAKLAKNNQNKVLVLEAGTYDAGFLFNIPSFGLLLQNSLYDWNFVTESQKYGCFGLKNNQSKWPMGKIVGGSGKLNNMIYARGHKYDYDVWYKDCEDYNFERDVLAYFKRSENQLGAYANDRTFHSIGGALNVEDLAHHTILSTRVLEAVKELGYSETDLNSLLETGFMQNQVNQEKGERWSTIDYLLKILPNHPNLHLITNAFVRKISFYNQYEANGVHFEHFNKRYHIRARKEIILCAGVIGTPKILMLSGIGPEEHLIEIGINVWNNLPVGNNLMDHVTTGFDLIEINTTLSVSIASFLSPYAAWDYFYNGKGPWTTPGSEVLGMIKLENSYPELGFMVLPLGVAADMGLKLQDLFKISESSWNKYFSLLSDKITVTILPILLHPKSRGTVRLRNNDPHSSPIIDPQYLTSEEDVNILVAGIKLIKKLLNTKSMKKLNAKLVDVPFPGCEHLQFDTDTYWKCYIRHLTLTVYHPCGTCKMGAKHDSSTVVDFELKVHNTNKLRIADASVIPYSPSANINAAVVMLAEKIVDYIYQTQFLLKGLCYLREIFVKFEFCIHF